MKLLFWKKQETKLDITIAKELVDMAKLSYSPEEEITQELEEKGYTCREFINDKETDTQCFIASDDEKIVIAFRGTSSIKDAFTDLLIIKTPYPKSRRWFFKPRAHYGFVNAFLAVRHRIHEVLSRCLLIKPYKVYITGHSLGAALATLCAIDLKETMKINNLLIYTFGSPKVGNSWFARRFNKKIKHSYRFVNDDDVVPWLPPTGYSHVKTLVFINKKGELTVNPNLMERTIESLDNVFALLTGDAVKDHLSALYQSIIHSLTVDKDLYSTDELIR